MLMIIFALYNIPYECPSKPLPCMSMLSLLLFDCTIVDEPVSSIDIYIYISFVFIFDDERNSTQRSRLGRIAELVFQEQAHN